MTYDGKLDKLTHGKTSAKHDSVSCAGAY